MVVGANERSLNSLWAYKLLSGHIPVCKADCIQLKVVSLCIYFVGGVEGNSHCYIPCHSNHVKDDFDFEVFSQL